MIPIALFALALAVTWYAGRNLVAAVATAAIGQIDAPSLIFGSVLLWVGGGIALFLGMALRQPAVYPGPLLWVALTFFVVAVASAVVVFQTSRIEFPSQRRTRDDVDQRVIGAGALVLLIAIIMICHAL